MGCIVPRTGKPGASDLELHSVQGCPCLVSVPGVSLLRSFGIIQPPCITVSLQGMAQVNGVPRPGAAPGQPCIFKLVLLGSGSVGKSSLALRYVKNDFKSILPTVGCK